MPNYEEIMKECLERRRKNFTIEILTKDSEYHENMRITYPEEDEIVLSVFSGSEFYNISLLPKEVDEVIKELLPHVSQKFQKFIECYVDLGKND